MAESQQGPSKPVDKRAGAKRRRGRGQKACKKGGRRKEAERGRGNQIMGKSDRREERVPEVTGSGLHHPLQQGGQIFSCQYNATLCRL